MNSSKADVDDKERKKNLRSADGSVNYLMFFNHYVQNITCNIIKLPSAAETLTTISPHLLIQRSLFFGLSRKKRHGTKGVCCTITVGLQHGITMATKKNRQHLSTSKYQKWGCPIPTFLPILSKHLMSDFSISTDTDNTDN